MKRIPLLLLVLGLLTTGCEVRTKDGRTLFSSNGNAGNQQQQPPASSQGVVDFPQPLDYDGSGAAQGLPATNLYEIETPLGTMIVRLYDETPRHRNNFKKLVQEGFYDGTTFHRVMENFMIQGGDPNSRDGDRSNDGTGDPGYTLKAEIRSSLHHKRGVLASARKNDQVNPDRDSNGSQFYLVHGRVYEEAELRSLETSMRKRVAIGSFTFSDQAIRDYTTLGGAPHLDRQYTVFGEMIAGFDVLDRIATLETDTRNNPLRSVPMTIRPAAEQ